MHAPLTLAQFVRFVFRVFYPDIWNESAFLQALSSEPVTRSITPGEDLDLHFDARQVMAGQ